MRKGSGTATVAAPCCEVWLLLVIPTPGDWGKNIMGLRTFWAI